MSQDTQDGWCSTLTKEEILALLQMADERMLHESGNPVLPQIEKELESNSVSNLTYLIVGVRIYSSVRSMKSAHRSENPDIEEFPRPLPGAPTASHFALKTSRFLVSGSGLEERGWYGIAPSCPCYLC